MLAGEIYEPKKIRLVDIEAPRLDKPDQILFQVELACLCGSDLPYFEGGYPEFAPQVGQSLHEMIGTVVETTGDRFRPGDRVLCVPDHHYGLWEQFAAGQERAIPLAEGDQDHLLLAQPLGTVICAMRKLPQIMDWNVVVLGQGPMGQLFCSVLRMLGARQVIAVEPVAERRAVSTQMGASLTIDPSSEDVVETVREATGGAMADLVVEAVGHREQQVNLAIALCRPRGQLLVFGVPCDKLDDLDIGPMFWKNLSLTTSVVPDFEVDFPLAMRWLAEERLDLRPVITHRFPLAEIQQAFDLFHGRRDGALKVFIDFPRGAG